MIRSSTRLRQAIAGILAVVALSGCGGGGGGGSSSPGNTAQISDKVRVIPTDGTVSIQQPSNSQLVLTGAVPSIKEGDVLLANVGNGILRKAKSVLRSREGEVTVETEPGTLEDVFTNAEIAVVRTLGVEDVDDRSRDATGTSIEPSSRIGGAIHIAVPERVIGSVGGIDVKLDGGVDLSMDLDFQLSVSALRIQRCRAVLTNSGTATLRVRGGFNGINIKHHLRHISFKPITIVVGSVLGVPVPLVIKPDVDIYVVVRGDMVAEFVATATASATVQGGAEYNGTDWSLVKSFSKGFDLSIERNFSAGSTVTFCPLYAEATVRLYDVVGPTFTFEPNFVCRYERSGNPAGLNVNVQGAFSASAAIKAEAFGKTLIDRNFPNLLSANFSVFDRFFPDQGSGGGGSTGGGGGGTGGSGGGGGEPGAVIIDNSNIASSVNAVGFFKWGTPGYWRTAMGLGLNGSMLWTRNNHLGEQPLDNVGQWRPNLAGGRYEVLAYIPRNYATTTNACYEIWVSGTMHTRAYRNQLQTSDDWISLGTYDFPAGSGSFVRLLDTTNEPFNTKYIGFDAMKFVRL